MIKVQLYKCRLCGEIFSDARYTDEGVIILHNECADSKRLLFATHHCKSGVTGLADYIGYGDDELSNYLPKAEEDKQEDAIETISSFMRDNDMPIQNEEHDVVNESSEIVDNAEKFNINNEE